MTNEERLTAIEALGLTYSSAEFVPQSKSRNAGEKEPSLNWRVMLKRNGVEIVTDYMQGIGYLPKFGALPNTQYEYDAWRLAAEHGKLPKVTSYGASLTSIELERPNVLDVLYSLTMDADAIDYAFDEWCANYGYDTDSRKAEATYKECLQIAIKLRRMVGDEGLHTLRAIFADY
jgi:hypothetical protein